MAICIRFCLVGIITAGLLPCCPSVLAADPPIGEVSLAPGEADEVLPTADGFGQNATGGRGGTVVTVATPQDFKAGVEANDSPRVIKVSGVINLKPIGGGINIRSNKTITGTSPAATIIGRLGFSNDANNVIIEGLNITNPSYAETDGVSIKSRITNFFITKCAIYDCGDGCLDIINESDYVTVSWCKFYYTDPNNNHRFVNLIGANDSAVGDRGKLHVTIHHNWFANMCVERMPRVRFGQVHVYNNYYSCKGNNYCIRPGVEAQMLVENNYFDAVDEPIQIKDATAMVKASGNIFNNCTGVSDDGNDDVFTPPYSYTPDDANNIPQIVMTKAGNTASLIR